MNKKYMLLYALIVHATQLLTASVDQAAYNKAFQVFAGKNATTYAQAATWIYNNRGSFNATASNSSVGLGSMLSIAQAAPLSSSPQAMAVGLYLSSGNPKGIAHNFPNADSNTNLQAALTAAASYTTPYPSTTTPTTGSTVSTESTTPSTQSGNNITTSNTQPLITLNQIPSATVNTSTTTANDSSNQNSSANNKNTQAPVSGTPPVSTPNSEALTLAAQTLKAQINAAIDVYNQYAPNTFVKVS